VRNKDIINLYPRWEWECLVNSHKAVTNKVADNDRDMNSIFCPLGVTKHPTPFLVNIQKASHTMFVMLLAL
jgi:hypothetical protein